jgi:hypothetical protein
MNKLVVSLIQMLALGACLLLSSCVLVNTPAAQDRVRRSDARARPAGRHASSLNGG